MSKMSPIRPLLKIFKLVFDNYYRVSITKFLFYLKTIVVFVIINYGEYKILTDNIWDLSYYGCEYNLLSFIYRMYPMSNSYINSIAESFFIYSGILFSNIVSGASKKLRFLKVLNY